MIYKITYNPYSPRRQKKSYIGLNFMFTPILTLPYITPTTLQIQSVKEIFFSLLLCLKYLNYSNIKASDNNV